jgi:hypothetical protein
VDHRQAVEPLGPAAGPEADEAVLDVLAPAGVGGDVEEAEKHPHLGVGDGDLGFIFLGF